MATQGPHLFIPKQLRLQRESRAWTTDSEALQHSGFINLHLTSPSGRRCSGEGRPRDGSRRLMKMGRLAENTPATREGRRCGQGSKAFRRKQ